MSALSGNEPAVTLLTDLTIPLRLSCLNQTGWPIILSLWYELGNDGLLYCATQESARVVRYIRRDNRCSFEVSVEDPPYKGVRGKATAVVDKTRGAEILERLLVRYLGNKSNPLASKLLAKSETEVAIVVRPTRLFYWDYTKRMQNSLVDS